jgi:Fur family ferric uptake transcriptional regulator
MQRDTKQRRAIRRVFLDAGRPLTPEEVVEEGQRFAETLGIATVYRNVKRLAEDGWLAPVELPGAPVRYELADRPHHHHFVCDRCDQAFDVHACPPDIDAMAPSGFQVESHDIFLYGTCPACVR